MSKVQQLHQEFLKLDTDNEVDAFDTACRIALTAREMHELNCLIYQVSMPFEYKA